MFDKSEHGRRITRLRKIVEQPCRQCGVMMVGIKTKRYCSPLCASQANYALRGQKIRARSLARYYAQKAAKPEQ